jgi:hypothetical protein
MIETLEDWNARLSGCGCCLMPECPQPSIFVQDFPAYLGGVSPFGDDYNGVLFKKVTGTFTQTDGPAIGITVQEPIFEVSFPESPQSLHKTGGSYFDDNESVTLQANFDPLNEDYLVGTETNKFNGEVTPISVYNGFILGFSFNDPSRTINFDGNTLTVSTDSFFSYEFDQSVDVYENCYSATQAYNVVLAAMSARPWPELGGNFYNPSATNTTTLSTPAGGENVTSCTLTKSRFRFRIPNTHLGSKFTITYDVAEFPADAEVDPSFVSEDNVVEWIGPGDQEDPDSESWLTPWEEIDPPEVPGERRIVNIRYTCYTGTKYGVKPQVMGEAFEPPAP